jgi:hypothetical protein
MISEETFNLSRDVYGRHASWAVWGSFGAKPKDNMADLSMFDGRNIEKTLKILHTTYVVVALNISTKVIKKTLSNFHGSNGEVYKARFAFYGTPLWGSYMTDVLKDYKQSKANNVATYLKSREGKKFELECGKRFDLELECLGAGSATLIALGSDVYSILKRLYPKGKNIIKIPHYGWWANKENYRSAVHRILDCSTRFPIHRDAISDSHGCGAI